MTRPDRESCWAGPMPARTELQWLAESLVYRGPCRQTRHTLEFFGDIEKISKCILEELLYLVNAMSCLPNHQWKHRNFLADMIPSYIVAPFAGVSQLLHFTCHPCWYSRRIELNARLRFSNSFFSRICSMYIQENKIELLNYPECNRVYAS